MTNPPVENRPLARCAIRAPGSLEHGRGRVGLRPRAAGNRAASAFGLAPLTGAAPPPRGLTEAQACQQRGGLGQEISQNNPRRKGRRRSSSDHELGSIPQREARGQRASKQASEAERGRCGEVRFWLRRTNDRLKRSSTGVVSTPLQRGCDTLRSMNANFCILRTAKLTSLGNVAASAAHTFRERPTPNADQARTHLNDNRGALSAAALVEAVQERVALAERTATARPVLCIEYLITATPEALAAKSAQERAAYFADALRWVEERHGKANVVCSSLQRDESTEHLVVYAVPLVEREAKQRKRSVIVGKGEDGKPIRETRLFSEPAGVSLSAKDFLGGRDKLSRMQTEFAEKVGQQHGLQRGVEGSKAVHKRNADIGAMSAERLALRKQVKELQDEIERLTQQVTTSGGALAAALKKAERQQKLNVEYMGVERKLTGELAQTQQSLAEAREALRSMYLEADAAKSELRAAQAALQASEARVVQVVTQRDRELAAHAAAMREANAGYQATLEELRAVNAVLVEQARERLAAAPQAAAPLDKAQMGKAGAAAPATVEQAQAAAIRAEEKRLGFKLARNDPRAAAIRVSVRQEWEAAEAARLAPPEPPRELEREKPKARVVERPKGRGGRD